MFKQKELAAFIAHVQADGSYSKKDHSFRYFNNDSLLINHFSQLTQSLFSIKTWKPYVKSNGCLETGFKNKKIAYQYSNIQFSSLNWKVPEFVKNGSKIVKSYYLRAFFDDESNVLFRKRKEGYDREIKMMLVNEKGIREIQVLLSEFSINCHIYGPFRQKYYDLKICGKENLVKFQRKIGFNSRSKIEKLAMALSSYRN